MTRLSAYLPGRVYAALVLFGAVTFVCSAETRAPSDFAAETVREALKEHNVAPKMERVPRTSDDLRRLVSRNLDPLLLTKTERVSGCDFQYQFADASRRTHLGVIVLNYHSVAVAKRMYSALAPRRNYFRNSKILIRFSAIPLGSLLVVTYSENSGDERIVEALKNLPASFEKASTAGVGTWSESEDLKVTHSK